MLDQLTLEDPAQLKALADARRLAILRLLVDAPMTSAQLAEALEETIPRLQYHIHELQKAELIEVVESLIRGNLLQKVYRARARYYTLAHGLLSGEAGTEHVRSTSLALLERAGEDLRRLLDAPPEGFDPASDLLHTQRILSVRPEDRPRLQERLRALLAEFSADGAPEDRYLLTLFGWPAPQPPKTP